MGFFAGQIAGGGGTTGGSLTPSGPSSGSISNLFTNAGGSNWPRTAIQPAAPAMPSVKPSTQCESHVKRFV